MNPYSNTIGRILYKQRPSEFEIQAEIYHLLRQAGIQVRGEVIARQLLDGRIRRCKFDLVAFLEKRPIAIIETKTWQRDTFTQGLRIGVKPSTKQFAKYRSFGLPIFYCGHLEHTPLVLDEVQKLIALQREAA